MHGYIVYALTLHDSMSLCAGEYGIVYKGRMISAVDRTVSQVVAVKTLKGKSI